MAAISGSSGLSTNAHLSCSLNRSSIAGEGLVVADAARQHEGRDVERIARELAKDEADLAGVDVFLFQLRKDLAAEGRAMRAGQRAVFDHRHARGIAHRQFRQRPWLEQRGHVDRSIGLGRRRRGGEGAMRGERRGGKDGGEGKPAKRGEGQSELLRIGRSGRRTNAHKGLHAASPSFRGVQTNRTRLGASGSQARYRPDGGLGAPPLEC